MSSRPWILITPSSRGIGAALTSHLLRTTTLPILATTRQRDTDKARETMLSDTLTCSSSSSPSSTASPRDRLHVTHLDVTSEPTIASAAAHARSLFPPETHHLHLALAIPGVLGRTERNPSQVDHDAALETYKVNALGPLLLMKHFYGFLPRKATRVDGEGLEFVPSGEAAGDGAEEKGQATRSNEGDDVPSSLPRHATWLSMSARVGSIADDRTGGWYSYRSSKAAVASLCRSLDNFLAHRCRDRALAVAFHPGTVKTGLSRDFWHSVPEGKLFEPAFAAERLVRVVSRLRVGDRGKCWDWKGEVVPP